MVLFIGGMFLGFSLGFAIMALLAAASRPSKPKGRQPLCAIYPWPALPPKILNLRWRLNHRPTSLGSPWDLKGEDAHA
jgi:hypothetical protein